MHRRSFIDFLIMLFGYVETRYKPVAVGFNVYLIDVARCVFENFIDVSVEI